MATLFRRTDVASERELLTLSQRRALAQVTRDLGDGATATAGKPAWGDITGTLSNQTDLQAALDLKIEGVAWGDITGTLSNQTDLQTTLDAKIEGVAWGDITGTLANQTDLQAALDVKIEGVAWGDITGTITSQTDLNALLRDNETLHFLLDD